MLLFLMAYSSCDAAEIWFNVFLMFLLFYQRNQLNDVYVMFE